MFLQKTIATLWVFIIVGLHAFELSGQTQPRSVSLVEASDQQVTIRWNYVEGHNFYDILRASNPVGPYEVIATTEEIKSSQFAIFKDDDIQRGNEYCYKVRVHNTNGESSDNLCITITRHHNSELFTVSGKINYRGSPVSEVKISLEDPSGNRIGQIATTDASGNYQVKSVPKGKTGKLKPRKTGYNFEPELKVSDIQSDLTNYDFTVTNQPNAYHVQITKPEPSLSSFNTGSTLDIELSTNIPSEVFDAYLFKQSGQQDRHIKRVRSNGTANWLIPHTVASGNYSIVIKGRNSGESQGSHVFTINNLNDDTNKLPEFIGGSVSALQVSVANPITFQSKWQDEENNYLVNARVRYRVLGVGFWQILSMPFVNNSEPATFEGTLTLSNPGEYEYEFAVSDDDDLNGAPYLHITPWQGRGTFLVVDPDAQSSGCEFPDLDNESPYYEAVNYLCVNGIVNGNEEDGSIEVDRSISRGELAKTAYFSIQLYSFPFAEDLPAIYADLQKDDKTWYYIFAKNLLYLEYGDGISPFDRDKLIFDGEANITIAHTLKVLLETWNIPLKTGANPFEEDYSNHEVYRHLYTAYDLGIIDQEIDANANCSRGDAFEFLYKLMVNGQVSRPGIAASDFYIPPNITPENIGNIDPLANNYFSYGKTSFYIPGIGLPLVFGHNYQPFVYDLPGELFPLHPLGNNWTHTYNSYLVDLAGNIHWEKYFDRVVIVLPGGEMSIFRLSKGSGSYVSTVTGDRAKLKKTSPTQFVYSTLGGTDYTYVKITGTGVNYPFVLTSIQDRNGNTVTLNYENGRDGVHFQRLNRVVGTTGKTLTFEYHAGTDLLKEVIDPGNRHIAFEYGAEQSETTQLKKFTDAKLNVSEYEYESSPGMGDLLKRVKLPKGNSIDAEYEGRKLKAINTGRDRVNITRLPYSSGQTANYIQAKLKYESGGEITASFDQRNNLRKLEGLETYSAKFDHNDFPDIPSSISYEGINYQIEPDAVGNIRQFIEGSITSTFTHNQFGDLKTYTDLGTGTSYERGYDPQGNLISSTTPLGTTQLTRLSNGLVSNITNPEGISVDFTYNRHGDVEKTEAPEGISSSATYDNLGRVRTVVRPDGQTQRYSYDENDNTLESLTGLDVSMGYDENDNLLQVTNAKAQITKLSWETERDLLEELEFGGRKDQLSYNEAGLLELFTKPDGTKFTYKYSDDEKLKSTTGGGKTMTFTYTGENLSQVDYNGTTNGFFYDNQDRLERSVQPNGEVAYTRNSLGQVTKIKYPNGKYVDYTYEQGILKQVKDWNNNSVKYDYRKDGLLKRIDYSNGTYGLYIYDGAGRLSELSWHKTNDEVISSYKLELNPMGYPLREIRVEPYDLDALDLSDVSQTFSYATENNEIVQGGGLTFEHDANGNITKKGTQSFSWDENDRLLETDSRSYQYDGLGLRFQSDNKTTGQSLKYVYDIAPPLPNVIYEVNTQGAYVYGLGLSWRSQSDGTVNFFHFDPRGNTIALTDANGEVTHKYLYSSYGKILAEEEADANPFKFSGQYGVIHEGENLYWMRARYYDAETGRFLSTDPIFDASNLYVYAGNNPLAFVDPSGENKYVIGAAAGLIVESPSIVRNSVLGFAASFDAVQGIIENDSAKIARADQALKEATYGLQKSIFNIGISAVTTRVKLGTGFSSYYGKLTTRLVGRKGLIPLGPKFSGQIGRGIKDIGHAVFKKLEKKKQIEILKTAIDIISNN